METILLVAHTAADGSLAASVLEVLGLVQALSQGLGGAPFSVGLIGEQVQAGADQISDCGAQQIFGVAGADFAAARYGSDAAAVEALAKTAEASIIVAPATSRLNRVLPGVACRLQGRIDTHVTALTAVEGKPAISRWYYRQRLEAVQQRAQRPWCILVEPGCAEAIPTSTGKAVVQPVAVNLPPTDQRTQVTGVQSPASGTQTIRPDAALLFVAGAGWTKKQADGQPHAKEAEQLILDFLRHTRASLGSSKSLVDLSGEGQTVLSFLTHLNQIGQTGSTPRHPKGLSTCCHGEEPHAVGWRFVSERRAINLDPNCGWARGKADVLYVADAFKVMAKVNELLASIRA